MHEDINQMTAIIYRNTKTTLPNWVDSLHKDPPVGVAHQYDGYCFYIYVHDNGLWTQSIGLTATEQNNCELKNWVIDVFGAKEIQILLLTFRRGSRRSLASRVIFSRRDISSTMHY